LFLANESDGMINIDEDMINQVFVFRHFLNILPGQMSHYCGKLSPFYQSVA
jgi:hypothetical protein